jgi:lipid A 3-O-deacylase
MTQRRGAGRMPTAGGRWGIRVVLGAVLGLSWVAGAPVHAQETGKEGGAEPAVHLRTGLSWVDVDRDGPSFVAVEVTLVEDRPRIWRAGILLGGMVAPGGQAYGYAGIHLPVRLPLRIELRPSVAAGFYAPGSGRELGSPVEFRSSLAVGRVLSRGVRVEAYLYHLSNAGLGSRNPGLEGMGLGVSVPLRP